MSDASLQRGNTAYSYGSVTKTFHWLTALLILTAFPLGMIANGWAYDTSEALTTKGLLFSLHKTVGLAAFFVALARILWALSQPKPGLLHPDRKMESFLAELVHWMLYASMVIVPLSGWLHHAATTGFAPVWWPFGQSLPFVPKDDTVAHFFGAWHFVFTKVLGVSVLLHIAGAVKHHVIDRDLTLARMLPGRVEAGTDSLDHSRAPFWAAVLLYAVAIGGGSALGLSHSEPEGVQHAAAELSAPASAEGSGWAVQEGSLGISVLQFGSAVEGSFAEWTAAINFDPEAAGPEMGDVTVEIAIPSVTLGSVTAEALKPEFFAAEEFPVATFTAQILKTDAGFVAEGTLALKGAEMPLSLPFTLTLDGDTATMDGSTVIDRRDFGIGTTSYADDATVGFPVDVSVSLTATRN